MLFCTNECITTPGRFVRLWMHEASRVYCDKLVDHKDQDTFQKLMMENIKKVFAVGIPYLIIYLFCPGTLKILVFKCYEIVLLSLTIN